jgi:hypothetical protein
MTLKNRMSIQVIHIPIQEEDGIFFRQQAGFVTGKVCRGVGDGTLKDVEPTLKPHTSREPDTVGAGTKWFFLRKVKFCKRH